VRARNGYIASARNKVR